MKKVLIIGIFLVSFVYCSNLEYIKMNKEKTIKEKIVSKAIQYNIQPDLALAIAEVESEFNERNRNKLSTSYGLFGFLKETTRWTGELKYKKHTIKHYNMSIDTQIELAMVYISYLKKKYKNNTNLMLHEYSGNTEGYVKMIKKAREKYKRI